MNNLIHDIVKTQGFHAKQVYADIQIDECLPNCIGDEVQITQVFSNLLSNALKNLDPSRKGTIRIHAVQKKDYAVYCVEDNGIGIEKENLESVFLMFYRGITHYEGQGLGLSIVRRIVNQHNGRVWVKSEKAAGSRFYVELPMVP
jgi:signal transduction histidine kinase